MHGRRRVGPERGEPAASNKTGSFVYSALTRWLGDAVIALAIWATAPGR